MRFLGKDLRGVGFKELQQLEQLLNEGLLSVKDRKEQILMEQLEQSRIKEQRVMMENTNLRKQIEELRSYFPVSARPVGGYLEYNPETRNSPIRNGASSPEAVCKSRAENGDLMTTLHLGPPSHGHRKRKSPEKETRSSTSERQIDM